MELLKIRAHKSKDSYEIKQSYQYTGDDYWDWSVWVESTDKALDKIERVVYNLHFSFLEPVRIIKTRKNKFMLSTSGWGTFTIYARIHFKDETVLDLSHELNLRYPDETPAEE